MIVLLDANNLAMRSFHAARGRLSSEDGTETGTLQLFVNSLSRLLEEHCPTRFVTCWDGGGSTYREGLLPAYKAARRKHPSESPAPAFALVHRLLELTGIAQWQVPGVEADDLIAAAWHRHPEEKKTILSSDKDLLQLLDDSTVQVRFSSYQTPTDVWTRERVIADLGYWPEQVPLVMALVGDQSDGVPGMRGIGPKKAIKMLAAADWDLDRVMAAHPDQREIVALSHRLVDLLGTRVVEVEDVPLYRPLGAAREQNLDRFEALCEFCAAYQLRTIWDRAVGGTLWW